MDQGDLAVSATFTAEPLQDTLAFWMKELALDYGVRFAPFNQVFQQLLDPAGLLGRNRGVNAVLVRLDDWDGGRVEEHVDHFLDAVHAASGFPAPLVVVLCPGRQSARLEASLHAIPAVHLLTASEVERLYPVAEVFDPHAEELGAVPYTPGFFAALGTGLARKVHAIRSTPAKVIVLDCDDTLWKGICGEDGPEGVLIDGPRRALQRFMAGQRDEGMLLCLCSKNNQEDVEETFRCHPEMPLRLGDFVARRINWGSKSANLAALADELQLGLDTFIFIDDNANECGEVQAACPEVLTLPLPSDAAEIAPFLQHVWAFDRAKVTAEDRKRAALYAQRAERVRQERQAASLEEFIASLNLDVRIAPMTREQLPRVSQLTLRTNQMNVSGIRRSEAEVQEALNSGAECLTVEVADRFGSYGLTGVAIFRAQPPDLRVDTFLLSCRVLGKGVEHRLLNRLGEIAEQRGLPALEIPFVPSSRNRPALLFLESVGAEFRSGGLFRFPADFARQVAYKPGSKAPAAAPAYTALAASRRRVDYARIARELRQPERVLERVRAARRPAAAHQPDGAPRTELERRLAALWAELLHLPAVGIHDNFFDLGGHSLLAVQLLARVRRDFNADVSIEVVYAGRFTVAELAKTMETREIEQAGAGEYAALLAELEGLSEEEVKALLEQQESG